MNTRRNSIEDYAAAVVREKLAWEAVKGSLPGSPGFSQELWMQWRAAVDEADGAAARAKSTTSMSVPAPAHRSPFFGRPWPKTVRLPPILRGRDRGAEPAATKSTG